MFQRSSLKSEIVYVQLCSAQKRLPDIRATCRQRAHHTSPVEESIASERHTTAGPVQGVMDTSPTRQYAYILDTSPTAFFASGHRKNRHLAIRTAAAFIVVTQFLLYSVRATGGHSVTQPGCLSPKSLVGLRVCADTTINVLL